METLPVTSDARQLLPMDSSQLDMENVWHKTPSPVLDEPVQIRSPLSPLPSTSRAVNHGPPLDDNNSGYFDVTPAQLKPLPKRSLHCRKKDNFEKEKRAYVHFN